MKISFPASLYSLRIDKEGEATVTMKVPRTSLPSMTELATKTETLLRVTVEDQSSVV